MHAGRQILLPSQATNYPLSAEINSSKIDVGILDYFWGKGYALTLRRYLEKDNPRGGD